MRAPVQKEILAVDRVNLEIAPGEIFGLLGPNGAGKTTLVKLLTTLLRPTSGSAAVQGFDVVKQEDEVKKRIGFVAGEERSFYWRLTGRSNLEFFAALYGIPRSAISGRVRVVLDLMGFGREADNMVYSYSSGMKQKLAIARGLLAEPGVLFLDEPTKSVDVIVARELKQLVKDVLSRQQRRTILLATHRLDEAEELCDRIAIMAEGRILFCGTVAELRSRLGACAQYTLVAQGVSHARCERAVVTHGLTDAAIHTPNGNGRVTLDFALGNRDETLSALLGDLLASGGVIISCEKRERCLEEMFVSLVREG